MSTIEWQKHAIKACQLASEILASTEKINDSIEATDLLASLTSLSGGRCTEENPCGGSCAEAVKAQALELVEAFLTSLTTQVEELEKIQTTS